MVDIPAKICPFCVTSHKLKEKPDDRKREAVQ